MVRIIKRCHALLCQADIHQPLLQPVDENGQWLLLFVERGGVVEYGQQARGSQQRQQLFRAMRPIRESA